jgi:hypothetical protein
MKKNLSGIDIPCFSFERSGIRNTPIAITPFTLIRELM